MTAQLMDRLEARLALAEALIGLVRAAGREGEAEMRAPFLLVRVLGAPPGATADAILADALKTLEAEGVIRLGGAAPRVSAAARSAAVSWRSTARVGGSKATTMRRRMIATLAAAAESGQARAAA